jgi:hypothetical protein
LDQPESRDDAITPNYSSVSFRMIFDSSRERIQAE